MNSDAIKKYTPYGVLGMLMLAFLIMKGNDLSNFMLLNYELLLAFGGIIALNDLRTKTVPNTLVLLMLAAWTIIRIPQFFVDFDRGLRQLLDAVLGCFVGGGLFVMVYIFSKHGLGGGDVKFMAVAGLYLGFGAVLPTMMLGSIFAAVTGLTLIALKKIKKDGTIPLVPFLYAGMLITLWGL